MKGLGNARSSVPSALDSNLSSLQIILFASGGRMWTGNYILVHDCKYKNTIQCSLTVRFTGIKRNKDYEFYTNVYRSSVIFQSKVQHTHRLWRGKDDTASCKQWSRGGGWIGNLHLFIPCWSAVTGRKGPSSPPRNFGVCVCGGGQTRTTHFHVDNKLSISKRYLPW